LPNTEKCQVTDAGLEALTKAQQLLELHLSTKYLNSDDNENVTVEGFKAVLIKLKGLAVLELRLPAVTELIIGTGTLIQTDSKSATGEPSSWPGTSPA